MTFLTQKNIFLIILCLLGISIVFLSFLLSTNKSSTKNLDAFAKCLAEKKVTMYGAAWCTHCQNQKKEFGTSFQYVPYVECPQNTQVCLDKKVKGYPTWILKNGKMLIGEQSLETLSKETGCVLP